MVSSRTQRIARNAVFLLAGWCVLAAPSAFGGTLVSNPRDFAHEIATSTTSLFLADQVYTMGIARSDVQNFIIRFTLSGPAAFRDVPSSLGVSGAAAKCPLRSGGAGSTVLEYECDPVTAGLPLGSSLTLSGASVRFSSGSGIDSAASCTVDLRDLFGPLDTVGTLSRTFATLKAASSLSPLTLAPDTGTTVDVKATPPRTAFVVTTGPGADDLLLARAPLTVLTTTTGVTNAAGTADHILSSSDKIIITLTGDFTGVGTDGLFYDLDDGSIGTTVDNDTAERFTISGNTATLTITGAQMSFLGGAHNVVFNKT